MSLEHFLVSKRKENFKKKKGGGACQKNTGVNIKESLIAKAETNRATK